MDNIAFLIDYHLWAHKKILKQLAELPAEDWSKEVGGSFSTLKALYQHLLHSDYRWLQRWNGVPFSDIPAGLTVEDYDSLAMNWLPLLDEMYAAALLFLRQDIKRPVNFITARGLDITQPFWQTLYQVVNHGTYHRGQVTNMLRILGRQPVTTDVFIYFEEKK